MTPRLAGFDDQRNAGARSFANQMVMNGGERQQTGNGREFFVNAAIGKNQKRVAGFHGQ